MEKTINILIASTAFSCSQEAYDRLSSYLESLRAHFESEADREEIMRDIESRIAEKLLERKREIITSADVSAVIEDMGEVSEIEDGTMVDQEGGMTSKSQKRLYRNTDDALIGGVASGIAAYFKIDPLIVRLIFVATVFFGGTGVFIYVILWILVPEAKNAFQKLEMQGKPVTLDTISHAVKERVQATRDSGVTRRVLRPIRIFAAGLGKFLVKLFGSIIVLAPFLAVVVLTVVLGVILMNWGVLYNDIPIDDVPIRDISSYLLFSTTLIAAYVSVVIPLIFVFALGYRLVRGKKLFPAAVGSGLIGVWALVLIIGGIGTAKILGNYYEYVRTSPEYAIILQESDLQPYKRVVVDGVRVTLREGEEHRAILEGRARDMRGVTLSVNEGTLVVRATDISRKCLFCSFSLPEIVIYQPELDAIEIDDGSATLEDVTSDEFSLSIDDGAIYGSLSAEKLSLASVDSRVRLDIVANDLGLEGIDSFLTLSGTVQTANISLEDSAFYGGSLVIQDALVSADDSYAELDVRGDLEQGGISDSRIQLN